MSEKSKEYYEARELVFPKAQRMIFCNVVEPKAPPSKHGKTKERFSATFLLDPADPLFSGEGKSIQRLSLMMAKEHFPQVYQDALAAAQAAGGATVAGVIAELKKAGIGFPFDSVAEINEERRKNGDSSYPGEPEQIHFRASSTVAEGDRYKYRPRLGSVETGRGVLFGKDEIAMHADKFYPGAEAFAVVSFAGFLVDGKRTVKAYLNQVFVTGRGERLGGNGGADRFDQFLGKDTVVNPITGDGVGHIPDVI